MVIDPKRDLVEAILDQVPVERTGDVVVLDPTDTSRPVGLNVLRAEPDSEAERELVSEHLLGVFQSLWKDSWGPRSDDILRASLLTLASARANDGSAFTLVELPELLTNSEFRRAVLAQDGVPEHVRGFWKWFASASPVERSQAMAPVLNKVRAFTMRTPMRLMLGQSEGFDLRTILNEPKVVLVPLSAGELGRPAAELLGSLIVARLWQVIRSRTQVAPAERRPIFIYLDEFQDVLRLPVDLGDLLAQATAQEVGDQAAAAVGDAARQDRRKGGLRPAHQLHGRRAGQERGGGLRPQDMVHQVIGAEHRIGDAVAVQVEGRMVGPEVATAFMAPLDMLGADVFHLLAVADEGVFGQHVAFRPLSLIHI